MGWWWRSSRWTAAPKPVSTSSSPGDGPELVPALRRLRFDLVVLAHANSFLDAVAALADEVRGLIDDAVVAEVGPGSGDRLGDGNGRVERVEDQAEPSLPQLSRAGANAIV